MHILANVCVCANALRGTHGGHEMAMTVEDVDLIQLVLDAQPTQRVAVLCVCLVLVCIM